MWYCRLRIGTLDQTGHRRGCAASIAQVSSLTHAVVVEFVDGAEHCGLHLGPSPRPRAALHRGSPGLEIPPGARNGVLSPLVLREAEQTGTEDGELAETGGSTPVTTERTVNGIPLAEEVGCRARV